MFTTPWCIIRNDELPRITTGRTDEEHGNPRTRHARRAEFGNLWDFRELVNLIMRLPAVLNFKLLDFDNLRCPFCEISRRRPWVNILCTSSTAFKKKIKINNRVLSLPYTDLVIIYFVCSQRVISHDNLHISCDL